MCNCVCMYVCMTVCISSIIYIYICYVFEYLVAVHCINSELKKVG